MGAPTCFYNREAQLPCTLDALGFLKCDFLAYKLLEFIFRGPPEMLAWSPRNPFPFNHDPNPRKPSRYRNNALGARFRDA